MVNFIPRPLYLQGNHFRCPLDRRPGGPQSRFGCFGERKESYPCRESNPGLEQEWKVYYLCRNLQYRTSVERMIVKDELDITWKEAI
jgi:hypothetical protein